MPRCVKTSIVLLLALLTEMTPALSQASFEEPAVLLSTAVYRDGDYYTLACVAYGEPLPLIEWLARNNRSDTMTPAVNSGFLINSTEIVTSLGGYDIVSVLSVLLACEDGVAVNDVECSASNGLHEDGFVGYQRAVFAVNNNFTVQILLGEFDESYSTTSTSEQTSEQPSMDTAVDVQTNPVSTAPIDNVGILFISLAVVICVAVIAIAVIVVSCTFGVTLYRSRKNLAVTRGGSIPLQGVQYHPYSHLEHEDISPVRAADSWYSPLHSTIPLSEARINSQTNHLYSSIAPTTGCSSGNNDNVTTAGRETVQSDHAYQPHYENIATSHNKNPPKESVTNRNSLVYCSAYSDSGTSAGTTWIYSDSPNIGSDTCLHDGATA